MVATYRQLATDRPDAFLAGLATSLNNQSGRMSELGLCEEALAAVDEAVAIRRVPAAALPHVYPIPARIPLSQTAPDMIAWKPRSSKSSTPSRWPPTTPKPRSPRPGRPLRPRRRRSLRSHPRSPHHPGDIQPGDGQLLIRLDPLTAPRRTQVISTLGNQLNQAQARYPGTRLALHYQVKPHHGLA